MLHHGSRFRKAFLAATTNGLFFSAAEPRSSAEWCPDGIKTSRRQNENITEQKKVMATKVFGSTLKENVGETNSLIVAAFKSRVAPLHRIYLLLKSSPFRSGSS